MLKKGKAVRKAKKDVLVTYHTNNNDLVELGKMGDLYFYRQRWTNLYNEKITKDEIITYPDLERVKEYFLIRLNVDFERNSVLSDIYTEVKAKVRELV